MKVGRTVPSAPQRPQTEHGGTLGTARPTFPFRSTLLPICLAALLSFEAFGAPAVRIIEVHPQGIGSPGFTLMDAQTTGVWFTNELQGELYLTNAVAHNGAGVAIGDVDGDGWADLYLCSVQGPNRLYRNLGQWRFEEMDLGEASCRGQLSTAAAFADLDGDGDLDLLVNGIAAGTRLFFNDGKGKWTEAHDSGLSRTNSAMSMALADIDGDGDLDLYCAHYIDVMHLADPTTTFALAKRGDKWEVTKVNGQSTRQPKWRDRFEALPGGKVRELPEVHGLYRNDGHGHFTAIQFEPGVYRNESGAPIPPYRDWGLAAMFRDVNGDGAPDLYVCNDFASPDRFWINSGTGTFRAIDPFLVRHTSRSAMGVDFADVDRDGRDDFVVVDMLAREHPLRMTQLVKDSPETGPRERPEEQPAYNRNTLFLHRPDGSFAETALFAGVAATDWSWCPIFLDVDLDGYEDLLVSSGFSFNVMDQDAHDQIPQRKLTEAQLKRSRQLYPAWPSPKAAFRNRGDGTFEPMERQWRLDQKGISYGMALGDLDNDGDLDLVINNLNERAGLYRNDAPGSRVAVRLQGRPPNTAGVGARIRLIGGAVTQSQEMICAGRYLSADQAMRVFAANAVPGKRLELEIRWRNGERTLIQDIQENRIYEVAQTNSVIPPPASREPVIQPLFVDVSALLNHAHVENAFDDWNRQPLLPRRLSRLGPGMSWFDFNGDGWEDLIVTAGQGGKLAVFASERGQAFKPVDGSPVNTADEGAVLGWPDGQGNRRVLAAVSNYEPGPPQESQLAIYAFANGLARQLEPAGLSSPGPLAAADIDRDGDLDLFVGGRVLPGRYPEAASSAIWLNENGTLRRNPALSQPFEKLGLVSGAIFTDLDGDGQADLVCAIEWGPIRLFQNRSGHFVDVTQQWGLADSRGWWTSVTAADFDGDGRVDLAAGNWGRNSPYELCRPGPIRAYYGDWNGDGKIDLVEAWQNNGRWLPVRDRLWLERGLADVQQRFPTHAAYAPAALPDILGERFDKATLLEVVQLESSIFLNRGSHFERIPLPRDAQLSPVFSVNAGDFDADGKEDLFISQNFFGTAWDISRDDAGRGLCLQGLGNGTFRALDSTVTGVIINGEQRGAALADFDHDGRLDLAVSQNNGPTKLYRNQAPKRGFRVRLHGTAQNPEAVGAQVRLLDAKGGAGPVRPVQAGSGYWSQDGAVQVLGAAQAPAALWIRWPGGREQTIPWPEASWEIEAWTVK